MDGRRRGTGLVGTAVVAIGMVMAWGPGVSPAWAQVAVTLQGAVTDAQRLPLPGATLSVVAEPDGHLTATDVTDAAGAFSIGGLEPGAYRIVVRLQGFRTYDERVTLGPSTASLAIVLQVGGFAQQVTVTAQMPELTFERTVPGGELERTVAQDVAGYLRAEPGVNAVRRGAINLEPTVRGLYEAEMGVFVDGTRTFAAGPARMDSEISHVSPHMLESVQVVKGPYALTEGSGTLSSLSAQTFRPAFSGNTLRLHGRGTLNFVGNGTASDGFGGIWAATDRVRFTLFHNTQVGHDYTDGAGATVPGGYQSYDTRWDLGVRPTRHLRIEYEGRLPGPGRARLSRADPRCHLHQGELAFGGGELATGRVGRHRGLRAGLRQPEGPSDEQRPEADGPADGGARAAVRPPDRSADLIRHGRRAGVRELAAWGLDGQGGRGRLPAETERHPVDLPA